MSSLNLAQYIRKELPGTVKSSVALPDQPLLIVEKGSLKTLARWLQSNPIIDANLLVDALGVDYLNYGSPANNKYRAFSNYTEYSRTPPVLPAMPERFAMVYLFYDIRNFAPLGLGAQVIDIKGEKRDYHHLKAQALGFMNSHHLYCISA